MTDTQILNIMEKYGDILEVERYQSPDGMDVGFQAILYDTQGMRKDIERQPTIRQAVTNISKNWGLTSDRSI